jgi:hypothetical protein
VTPAERIQLERQRRGSATLDDWIARPLGTLGDMLADPVAQMAAEQALIPGHGPRTGALRNTAGVLRHLPRVVGYGVPAVMAATSGYEQGGMGGAGISAGSTLLGGVLGGPLGAIAGGFVGDLATRGAVAAVDAHQGGDTGPLGLIGGALDPFITDSYEREQQAMMRELNSPAMQQLKAEEERRKAKARADAMFGLLVQSGLS